MKKIVFIFLAFALRYNSVAQLVVEAPTLETLSMNQTTILGSMNVTMTAIEQARQKVEKLQEMSDWIKKLESMQEFIELLETTACMAKDLDVNLRLALNIIGPRASCFDEFKYKININRL